VVGCTIGSRGEIPGERKPVIREADDNNNYYYNNVTFMIFHPAKFKI
jgi:hypothetical protein